MLQIVLCSFIIDRNDNNKKRVFYFCFCANIYNKCKEQEQDKSVKRQPIDVFVNILIYIIYINMYVNYTQLYIYIYIYIQIVFLGKEQQKCAQYKSDM